MFNPVVRIAPVHYRRGVKGESAGASVSVQNTGAYLQNFPLHCEMLPPAQRSPALAAAQSCDHHLQTSPHLPGPGLLLAAGWRLWWCRIQTFTRCTGHWHHWHHCHHWHH